VHGRASIIIKTRMITRKAKQVLLGILLFGVTHAAYSQETDSARYLDDFTGSVSITTKGISTIPNLTLGKPAALFRMTAEKNGLSFEPELRFSLEGQPWSFLFWWRYDLVRKSRFRLDVGAHPAISFRPFSYEEDGVVREVMEARRFVAGEVSSGYQLAKNMSIGVYYLYSHGFERTTPDHINYLSFNGSLSSIGLSDGFLLSLIPQVYYLAIDGNDGFYFTLRTTLSRSDFPLSISSLINTAFQTDISGGEGLLWNVSLTYSFDLID